MVSSHRLLLQLDRQSQHLQLLLLQLMEAELYQGSHPDTLLLPHVLLPLDKYPEADAL